MGVGGLTWHMVCGEFGGVYDIAIPVLRVVGLNISVQLVYIFKYIHLSHILYCCT